MNRSSKWFTKFSVKKIKSIFTNSWFFRSRCMPAKMKDKIMMNILVLGLILDDFNFEYSHLLVDLKVSYMRWVNYFISVWKLYLWNWSLCYCGMSSHFICKSEHVYPLASLNLTWKAQVVACLVCFLGYTEDCKQCYTKNEPSCTQCNLGPWAVEVKWQIFPFKSPRFWQKEVCQNKNTPFTNKFAKNFVLIGVLLVPSFHIK